MASHRHRYTKGLTNINILKTAQKQHNRYMDPHNYTIKAMNFTFIGKFQYAWNHIN